MSECVAFADRIVKNRILLKMNVQRWSKLDANNKTIVLSDTSCYTG
jgi:hypothetical protein